MTVTRISVQIGRRRDRNDPLSKMPRQAEHQTQIRVVGDDVARYTLLPIIASLTRAELTPCMSASSCSLKCGFLIFAVLMLAATLEVAFFDLTGVRGMPLRRYDTDVDSVGDLSGCRSPADHVRV